MLRGSRVLILDESTSMLTPKGVDELGRPDAPSRRRAGSRSCSSPTSSGRRPRSATASRCCARPQGGRDRAGTDAAAGRGGNDLRRARLDVRRAARTPRWWPRSSARRGRSARMPRAHAAQVADAVASTGDAPGRHRSSISPGRDPRHRRHRRQRAEATGRSPGGPGARPRARSVLDGRHRGARRRGAPPARPPLRDRRPARRGHGRHLPGLDQLLLKQIGEAPFWRHGLGRPRGHRGACPQARRSVRHPHAERRNAHRPAVGRQHPEGAAGARTRGSGQGRDLQQADLRARSAEHRRDTPAVSATRPSVASRCS